jgi:hypothetical protein
VTVVATVEEVKGAKVEQMARRCGVSQKAVYEYLAEAKEAEHEEDRTAMELIRSLSAYLECAALNLSVDGEEGREFMRECLIAARKGKGFLKRRRFVLS